MDAILTSLFFGGGPGSSRSGSGGSGGGPGGGTAGSGSFLGSGGSGSPSESGSPLLIQSPNRRITQSPNSYGVGFMTRARVLSPIFLRPSSGRRAPITLDGPARRAKKNRRHPPWGHETASLAHAADSSWYRYFWNPANTFPISSGLPRSATASAMESRYFSRSNGVSFS